MFDENGNMNGIENGNIIEKGNIGKLEKFKLLSIEFIQYLRKKDYLLGFITMILCLPISIYLLTSFFQECHDNFIRKSYKIGNDAENCYCENSVTVDSLEKYLIDNKGITKNQIVDNFITDYKYSFNNFYNLEDKVMDLALNDDELVVNDIIINNFVFDAIQVVSLIPLTMFYELKESLKIKRYNLNTSTMAYSMMMNIKYNYTDIGCFLTTFNSTYYNIYFTYTNPFYLTISQVGYQLDDIYYVSCSPVRTNFVIPNNTYILEMMKTSFFKEYIIKANNSVVNLINNDVFNFQNPQYCKVDFCYKLQCLNFEFLSTIILIGSLCNLMYMFTKFSLHVIYKIKEMNLEQKKIEMVIISK
jgi:hypothetical protein